MNKQIRKYFPKQKSVDSFSQKDIKKKNINLLESPIRSLDGNTPKDVFIAVYGGELYFRIFDVVNVEHK